MPATTLDTLARELALVPPFLLELDVQGAEESVLRGAREVLQNCEAVICEADIEDFQNLNRMLVDAGFFLRHDPVATRGRWNARLVLSDLHQQQVGAIAAEFVLGPPAERDVIRKQVERRERS